MSKDYIFATLSAENRIRDRMALLGVSGAFLAALAGIQPARLSRAFRGLQQLEHDDAKKLLNITTELLELVEAIKPLSLPLSNAADTERVLDHLRDNNISAETVRQKISELFAVQI